MSVFNSPFLLGFEQFERTIDRISKRYLSKLIETNDTNFDLVIVGAGFSGLEVAIQLAEKWKNKNKNERKNGRNNEIQKERKNGRKKWRKTDRHK